ncbi:MAG: alpha/beta fold hydrolase [Steroidobacteraceae bacterium]
MIGSEPVRWNIGRRAFLALGGSCFTLAAHRALRAAAAPKARFFIVVSGGAEGPEAAGWGMLARELAKRGFPTTLVPSIYPNASFTPNETRAAAIVTALQDADEPGVILGISNEGNVLPLVAAAHGVRRLVYVNACIPQPRKAFIEVCASQPVAVPGSLLDKLIKGAQPVTDEFLKLRADPHATAAQWQTLRDRIQASPYASSMKGFFEVCPLEKMPEVDNIDVSGAADDQINPAWEQVTARRVLTAEPVIVPGAGHANVVTEYAARVADAAVREL